MHAGAGGREVGFADRAGNRVGPDWIRPAESEKCVAVISVECRVTSHPQFCSKACVSANASGGGRVDQLLTRELFHLVRVPAHSAENVRRKG